MCDHNGMVSSAGTRSERRGREARRAELIGRTSRISHRVDRFEEDDEVCTTRCPVSVEIGSSRGSRLKEEGDQYCQVIIRDQPIPGEVERGAWRRAG